MQVEIGLHSRGEAEALGAGGGQQRRHRDRPRELDRAAADGAADVLHDGHVALEVEPAVLEGHDRLAGALRGDPGERDLAERPRPLARAVDGDVAMGGAGDGEVGRMRRAGKVGIEDQVRVDRRGGVEADAAGGGGGHAVALDLHGRELEDAVAQAGHHGLRGPRGDPGGDQLEGVEAGIRHRGLGVGEGYRHVRRPRGHARHGLGQRNQAGDAFDLGLVELQRRPQRLPIDRALARHAQLRRLERELPATQDSFEPDGDGADPFRVPEELRHVDVGRPREPVDGSGRGEMEVRGPFCFRPQQRQLDRSALHLEPAQHGAPALGGGGEGGAQASGFRVSAVLAAGIADAPADGHGLRSIRGLDVERSADGRLDRGRPGAARATGGHEVQGPQARQGSGDGASAVELEVEREVDGAAAEGHSARRAQPRPQPHVAGGDARSLGAALDLQRGAPVPRRAEGPPQASGLRPGQRHALLAKAGDVEAGELQIGVGLRTSKTHHAVRAAAEEIRLERHVGSAVEPTLVDEVRVDSIDRPARDLEGAALDLRVQDQRLTQSGEPPGRGDAAADVGVEAEGLQVAEVDAGLQAKVRVERTDPSQRARDLDVRVQNVALERVDPDVEPGGDTQAAAHRAQGDRGLALPGPALCGHLERAVADGPAHGDAAERELVIRSQVVDDRRVRDRELADDHDLVHGGGVARRRGSDLEPGRIEDHGQEGEAPAEQEPGLEDDLGLGDGQAIGRPLDDEVFDVAAEPSGHGLHAADAAARTEPGLQAFLDVAAEDVLGEEAEEHEHDQDDREEDEKEEDAAASRH